ncbi:M15 family metallopeptidase [Paenibacillus sp. OSY-SE]|uniref:M15 family metallopeptidase n=1 Tax=Paenibacillus sp. OSY-SE TaxID=1196323 RepID=UPI000687C5F5|nr:M15 family metallopeptidase [Paenibacillus sp. OSY-SE]
MSNEGYRHLYICCMLVITMIAGCGSMAEAPVPNTSSTGSASLSSTESSTSSAASLSRSPSTLSTASSNESSNALSVKPESGKLLAVASEGPKTKRAADMQPTPISHDGMAILVNKQHALPDEYEPDDLVDPKVKFIFREKSEKRLMRREAARALERMFADAEKDSIFLAGVSAYRSQAAQSWIYRQYVKKHGKEQAMSYSAEPGHSEHKTGLAIDVSGSDGKCAVQDCFAGSAEAEWIARHAPEYGFILRYPKGKEMVTGYQYEPWHLRYVGVERAAEMAERKLTLEEYVYASTTALTENKSEQ